MRNFVQIGKKIVAIGRNYEEHAKELGNSLPSSPLFFLKPTSSYLQEGNAIEIPAQCEVHHEVELGVVVGKKAKNIQAKDAEQYIAGYALALDLTARNLQEEAKRKGWPWTMAKGYDTFCPISRFIEKNEMKDINHVQIWLKVDGLLKQNGNTKDMIFNIPKIIETVSQVMTLEPGDLILTGTPSGVGPIHSGQTIVAGLSDILAISFHVVDRP